MQTDVVTHWLLSGDRLHGKDQHALNLARQCECVSEIHILLRQAFAAGRVQGSWGYVIPRALERREVVTLPARCICVISNVL